MKTAAEYAEALYPICLEDARKATIPSNRRKRNRPSRRTRQARRRAVERARGVRE